MDKSSQKDLKVFQLSISDTPPYRVLGYGTYASVKEVVVSGTYCAAKHLRDDIFKGKKGQKPGDSEKRFAADFTNECVLMSNLRHPNIVQFMGITFSFLGSRQPALVMELMSTSLHELLDPEPPFFPLSIKCSVLHNIASGLAYLHERPTPIIHRNLSAKKILLNSGMVAKIADLAVARTLKGKNKMTKIPGELEYMPPEATESASTYNTSIDIFSLGILAIFTVGEILPSEIQQPTYTDEDGLLLARTEIQRRSKYMTYVNEKLLEFLRDEGHGECRDVYDHPVNTVIKQCLENAAKNRPNILEVLHLLEKAKVVSRDEEGDKSQLLQVLQANKVRDVHVWRTTYVRRGS